MLITCLSYYLPEYSLHEVLNNNDGSPSLLPIEVE